MQPPAVFRLVMRRGPQPDRAFDIQQENTSIGRDVTNDIVINDREISRHHLRLTRSGDTFTIEDLGSTNGTFVNGKGISGLTPLQDGDQVGLGETVVLALEVASSDPPADLAPGEEDTSKRKPALGTLPPPVPSYTPPPDYPLPGGGKVAQPDLPEPAAASSTPPAPDIYQQPDLPLPAPPAPPQQYPGYDYDPYAVRENSGGTSPWIILGCFVFFVLVSVCFAGIALTIIDVLNLWCEVPGLRDIVSALSLGC